MSTEILRETQQQSHLAEALKLAQFHVPVFPCGEDKRPLTKHGFKDATVDERQIRRWWGLRPGALIGTPTGIRFDALDIDVKHHEATEWLASVELPPTRVHRTRSGGWHYLFKPRPGLKNSVAEIAPGVDTRVRGAYIIWWPATGLSVEGEHLLAPWPDHLLATMGAKERPVGIDAFTGHANNVGKAWGPVISTDIGEGARNKTLTKVAGYMLRRYVAIDVTYEMLRLWNAAHCKPPLDTEELNKIIGSICKSEMRRRRANG